MTQKTYGPKEICQRANITARQLGYWKLIGVVRPRQELHGSKVFHRYTDWDLEVLNAVKKLTQEGYLVSKAADKIKAALASGEKIPVQELLDPAGPWSDPGKRRNPNLLQGMDVFTGRLSEEITRSRRFEYPLSCLAVKMDISPAATEEVMCTGMQEAGAILASCKRGYDVIAPVNGSEFLWLLCQTHAKGAETVARRVQSLLEKQGLAVGDSLYSIKVSYGISSLRSFEEDGTRLVEQARSAVSGRL